MVGATQLELTDTVFLSSVSTKNTLYFFYMPICHVIIKNRGKIYSEWKYFHKCKVKDWSDSSMDKMLALQG